MPQFHRRPLTPALIGVCILAVLANAGVVSAQNSAEPRAVRTSISPGGMGRYERGQWSVVSINASNGGDEETEATLSVFLENDSRTQFTRRFWLPARTIRKTWLPIRPPENIPPEQKVLHVSTLNVVDSADGAILSHAEGEQLISESLLSLDPSELHMGMISSRMLPGQLDVFSPRDEQAYETATEVRMLHDGERKIMSFSDFFLPPYPEAYDALDQLVICSDRTTADSGGLAAIRSWIARGGRAWIMLDLVGVEAVQTLLGNAARCEIVDRIELTEFTIETPMSATVGAEPTETWIAEEPVELVRVSIDSADVYSSIDGWPAAFSIPFGDGQVLITTLAARGWRYQYDEFAEPSDPKRPTSGPTNALRRLASEFNQQAIRHAALSDELKPILSEQLGYRVPSRGIAALILGLNCVVIVAGGGWLARRQQLERIAWVVPATTALSAIVLVMIGSANTSSIPASSSILRLANVSSETNEIHTDVLAAFYSPETVELPLQVDLSGVVAPELQDFPGVVKRAIWDDYGRGRWEQVDVASGSVRFVRAEENKTLEHPLRARATFGSNGLEGRIVGVGQIGTPTDAIIASPPAPHSDVKIDRTGAFQVGPNDILSATEFLSGAMLSDEQQRRQTIYREILAPREGNHYPQRSTLFVWGDSRSLGLTTSDLFQQAGATLYAVPLDIGRTLPKQPFVIPSTFIRMTNAATKQGASAFYNPRTGRWLKDATLPTQSFFQFLLPRQVMPCRVQSVQITLKIHAPSRTVELTGLKDNQQVTVKTFESPSGVLTITIDDPALLAVDESGGLRFGVTVSPTEGQVAAAAARDEPRDPTAGDIEKNTSEHSTWQIDYLHLRASGETR
ncbi:MAG: hypothetical protein O3C40_29855 [Planctomycetota bacterium]|nr:hypothetical protein [Planctomycetota bacterium]